MQRYVRGQNKTEMDLEKTNISIVQQKKAHENKTAENNYSTRRKPQLKAAKLHTEREKTTKICI